MSNMETFWIVVDKATTQEARIQVFKRRYIVFRATTSRGTLRNNHVVVRFVVGMDSDGRITTKLIKKARTKARVAMNAERRKPKFKSKSL